MSEAQLWNVVMAFIRPETTLIIGALIAFGYLLKSIPMVPNDKIPLAMTAVGILFAATANVYSLREGLMLGIVYSAFAIGSYEAVIKQLQKALEGLWKRFFGPPPNDPGVFRPGPPLVVLIGFSLILSGCAHNPPGEDFRAVGKFLVRVAVKATLAAAQGDDDLKKKLDIIGGASGFVGTLMTGEVLTRPEIEARLDAYFPDKTHWTSLGYELGGLSDLARPYLGNDPAKWIKFWGDVSTWLYEATK